MSIKLVNLTYTGIKTTKVSINVDRATWTIPQEGDALSLSPVQIKGFRLTPKSLEVQPDTGSSDAVFSVTVALDVGDGGIAKLTAPALDQGTVLIKAQGLEEQDMTGSGAVVNLVW